MVRSSWSQWKLKPKTMIWKQNIENVSTFVECDLQNACSVLIWSTDYSTWKDISCRRCFFIYWSKKSMLQHNFSEAAGECKAQLKMFKSQRVLPFKYIFWLHKRTIWEKDLLQQCMWVTLLLHSWLALWNGQSPDRRRKELKANDYSNSLS